VIIWLGHVNKELEKKAVVRSGEVLMAARVMGM